MHGWYTFSIFRVTGRGFMAVTACAISALQPAWYVDVGVGAEVSH